MPVLCSGVNAHRHAHAFARDRTGATAVEFALVAMPLLLLILFVIQVGIYFMTKSALDSGVILTTEAIRQQFNSGGALLLTNYTGCNLAGQVAGNSGTFVTNDATLSVEIQPLSVLDPALVAITPCLTNYGAPGNPGDVLVLRAKYTPASFMPGFAPTVTIYSSALVRRLLE